MGNPVLASADTRFELWPGSSGGAGVQQLATRVARSADEADAALARLAQVQMGQWQSPAGRAYRNAIARRAAELRRARDALREASALLMHRAALAAGNGF